MSDTHRAIRRLRPGHAIATSSAAGHRNRRSQVAAREPVPQLVLWHPDAAVALGDLRHPLGRAAVASGRRLGHVQHPGMSRGAGGRSGRLLLRAGGAMAPTSLRHRLPAGGVLAADAGLRASVRGGGPGALCDAAAQDAVLHRDLPLSRLLADLGRNHPEPDRRAPGFCRRIFRVRATRTAELRCGLLRRDRRGCRHVVDWRCLGVSPRDGEHHFARGGVAGHGWLHAEHDPRDRVRVAVAADRDPVGAGPSI